MGSRAGMPRVRVVGMLAAALLAVGPVPALGQPVQGEDAPPARTVEEAVAEDLGLTMDEFVRAGATAEQAAGRLGLESGRGGDLDGAPGVGRLTRQGVVALETGEAGTPYSAFEDLDELRERYLAEMGPDGLTGLAYTLEGYEVLVDDPDAVRERGRASTTGEVVSPSAWATAYPGVSVVGTTEPAAAGTVRGGASISFGGASCTHGFNGWYKGDQVGLAAGHCPYAGGTAVSYGGYRLGTVTWWQFGAPGSAWESYGTDLTTYSLTAGHSHPASVTTGSSTVTITGRTPAVLGLPVCKMGRRTGWTCSVVNKVGWQWIGDGSGDITRPKRWVWSLFADLQVIPGDSGGPWIAGHKAVGVTSSYDWYDDGRPYSTAALLTSLDDYRPGAQVKVWLGRPRISSVEMTGDTSGRARWADDETVSGRLSQPSGDSISPGTVVDVWVDGTRVASPGVSGDGSFSFVYPGSDSRSHTVKLRARQGDSRGTTLTVADEPAGEVPSVVRHAGENRYGTAAAIALARFPAGVDTVYLASGRGFADALSGGGRAGTDGSPILLTDPVTLPAATRDALTRLAPRRVVVLGGTLAVSESVAGELRGIAPTVERVGGANRYAVSAAIASTYPAGQSKVFVVSGEAFPDALGAAAVAGRRGVPLLITKTARLSDVVAAEIDRLDPAEIVIVGGPAAVSTAVESSLAAYAPQVTRVGGADRYAVSAALADRFTSPAPEAWVARGTDYPDALSAAPAAALHGGPVLLTKSSTLPSATVTALERDVRAPVIRIAGGTASVSSAVRSELRWLTYQ
ncbi:cell wall-binding repeat-containing protein [Ornithinimicrobium tianjinense]|nr:cell wall-binding repeat-containing protein [Ornithinimicrobium tianjinense]